MRQKRKTRTAKKKFQNNFRYNLSMINLSMITCDQSRTNFTLTKFFKCNNGTFFYAARATFSKAPISLKSVIS